MCRNVSKGEQVGENYSLKKSKIVHDIGFVEERRYKEEV